MLVPRSYSPVTVIVIGEIHTGESALVVGARPVMYPSPSIVFAVVPPKSTLNLI
jgi:hypothetical protein